MRRTFSTEILFAIITISMILGSCTTSSDVATNSIIQKRKYTKGYFFANKKKSKELTNTKIKRLKPNPVINPLSEPNSGKLLELNRSDFTNSLTASTNKFDQHNALVREANKNKPIIDGCDIIVLHSGYEIEARIVRITDTQVSYKMCNNPNGRDFSKSTNEIKEIRYADGAIKSFVEEKQETTKGDPNENMNANINLDQSTKGASFKSIDSSKKLGLAILLCAVLGAIGAHRFYLGKKKSGLAMAALTALNIVLIFIGTISLVVWSLILSMIILVWIVVDLITLIIKAL